MSALAPVDTLRHHRLILLACEAIGWFHMAGKARLEFLRKHGGDKVEYNDLKWHDAEQPPFPWDDLSGWVKNFSGSAIPQNAWPNSIREFTEKHRGRDAGILGLLQAGHGVTSGIEKNLPADSSEYLGQLLPHMWLSSPFGYQKRNLIVDPPEILSERGWKTLVTEMRRVLEELKNLALARTADVGAWHRWRQSALGPDSYVRQALLSTLAETRLPNNDVTLWDQSYVAAALFKSATAGALLDSSFPRTDKNIKSKIRWRLLTVSIGTDLYEARAVKIGDWTGVWGVLEQFFDRVARLIEVDLAVGSLLYRDSSTAVFSFPGERFDESERASWLNRWQEYLTQEVEEIARYLDLETPPLVRLSDPTRSLVPLVKERREAQKTVAIPIHKAWNICWQMPVEAHGHICPVCQVRSNGDPTNKTKPCQVCQERRHHRLEEWLNGQLGYDTIWFEEVADRNDRIALLTLSLDIEPWLEGERVDSLRAQAISEWRRFNPVLSSTPNSITSANPFDSLLSYIKGKLAAWDKNDPVLQNLQEGYRHESDWPTFFQKIVEDRAEAPNWNSLNDDQRAIWLAHQLFRKLPSPGRVYRFWREAQEFFENLLKEFCQIASRSENPWRVRRLLLIPTSSSSSGWKDHTLYDGRWRGAQFSLIYVQALKGFVTASNLARFLKPEEPKTALRNQEISLEEEDTFGQPKKLIVGDVQDIEKAYSHLGVYHPVISLELSPLRFRVIVPLESASECIDLALACWKEQFARVWDRLPLHVGSIAFDRTLPFQAVIEAARNIEERLTQGGTELWQVVRHEDTQSVVALALKRPDGQIALRSTPTSIPDGREDVFYPYVAVEDRGLRHPRDFRHPNGQVYRQVADLQVGDGVRVAPARLITLFLDTAGRRFEIPELRYAEDWEEMQEVWKLLKRVAPSQTALQRLRSELARLHREWQESLDKPSAELWQDTLRALLAHHLETQGAALETLTKAALKSLLEWTLDWHMTALKENV